MPKSGRNLLNPTTTRSPIVGIFFISINHRENLTFYAKHSVSSRKRKHFKVSNAAKNVRIFRLGADFQLSLYINVSAVKMRKLIVVSLQRFVLDRKVTLRTIWTYKHQAKKKR